MKAYYKKIIYTYFLANKLFSKYKWWILLITVFGFLAGFLEGIGIGMLIPIFSVIVLGDAGIGNDSITLYVVKLFDALNLPLNLSALLALIISLFVLRAIIGFVVSFINTRTSLNFETDTRTELYRRSLEASWPYLLRQKLGHLENTIMFDLRMTAKLLQEFISAILDATSFLMYVFVAYNVSRFITVLTMGFGLLLHLSLLPLVRKTREISKIQLKINKDIAHHVNEQMSGIKSIKAYGIEKGVIDKGNSFFVGIYRTTLKQSLVKNFLGSVISPVSMIFIVMVFSVSYLRPNFNLAIFAATMYFIQRILIHVNSFQKSMHVLSDLSPYFFNVMSLYEQTENNRENKGGEKKFLFKKTLAFNKVSFSYAKDDPILNDIEFSINKGDMVGVIGPSGVGKTTLVDLLLRLFVKHSGKILIDGVDIREIKTKEWRSKIGYVPQDSFLLNDSILKNIEFYNDKATFDDVVNASKLANIYDFIISLDNGFNTIVGERGVMLSGGQKQRIAFARALARNPEILVLDEATSSLDNESEALIQRAIENLSGKMTIIIIAHRLSTVMNATKLIVLYNGRINEIGSPSELLKDKDSYFSTVYNNRNKINDKNSK